MAMSQNIRCIIVIRGLTLFIMLTYFHTIHCEDIKLMWLSEYDSSRPFSYLHSIDGDPVVWIANMKSGQSPTPKRHRLIAQWTDMATVGQIIYGFNQAGQDITKTSYSTSSIWQSFESFFDDCSSKVMDIRVDTIHQNIYWIDDALNWIFMASLHEPKHWKAIIGIDIYKPRSLAVAPSSRFLFWSDSLTKRIERSNLFGDERQVLVSTNIEEPSDLLTDETGGFLYWLDNGKGTIEKSTYDGRDRTEVYRNEEVKAFQTISIYKNWLFAAVESENKIVVFEGIVSGSIARLSENITFSAGPETYSIAHLSANQQLVENKCKDAGCAELCVGSDDDAGYKCLCSEGYILNDDSKSCSVEDGLLNPSYVVHQDGSFCVYLVTEPLSNIANARSKCVPFDPDGHLAVNHRSGHIWMSRDDTIQEYDAREDHFIKKVDLAKHVGGLAIDWTSGQVYWTDSEDGIISTVNQEGKYGIRVISGLSEPTAIAVDPVHTMKIYWVENDENIKMSDFQGNNIKPLVESAGVIQRIVIDYYTKRLFWTDSSTGLISSIALDGSGVRTEVTDGAEDKVYGVAVFQDFVAWTAQSNIYWALKNGTNHFEDFKQVNEPKEIISFSEYAQPNINSVCTDGGGCQQLCFPTTKEDRACRCSLGYKEETEVRCKSEILEDNYLLVVDSKRREVYQMDLDNTRDVRAIPILEMQNPLAVALDREKGILFWSDERDQTIWKADMFSSAPFAKIPVLAIQSGVTSAIYGIAFDPDEGRLYYTDSERNMVASISTNGGQETTIYNDIAKPRGILVDVVERILFVTSWGDNPEIIRASLDTPANVTVLVSKALIWPNGLALDRHKKFVYWCDAKLNKIVRMKYDGTEDEVIFEKPGAHFYDIAFHNDIVYLTDWSSKSLLKIEKTEGGRFIAHPSGPDEFEHLNSVKVILADPVTTSTSTSTSSPTTTTTTRITTAQEDGRAVNNVPGAVTSEGKKELNWLIIGPVIGLLMLAILSLFIVVLVVRLRKDRKIAKQLNAPVPPTNMSRPRQNPGFNPQVDYAEISGGFQPGRHEYSQAHTVSAGSAQHHFWPAPRGPVDPTQAYNYRNSSGHYTYSRLNSVPGQTVMATPFGYALPLPHVSTEYQGDRERRRGNYAMPLSFNPTAVRNTNRLGLASFRANNARSDVAL